jgi:hypothetical protein
VNGWFVDGVGVFVVSTGCYKNRDVIMIRADALSRMTSPSRVLRPGAALSLTRNAMLTDDRFSLRTCLLRLCSGTLEVFRHG